MSNRNRNRSNNSSQQPKPNTDMSNQAKDTQTQQSNDILSQHIDTSVVEQKQEPVVQETPAVEIKPVVKVDKGIDTSDLEAISFTSVAANIAYQELVDYVKAMSNTKFTLTPQQGGSYQAGFYRAMVGAINCPAEDYKQLMDTFLAVIADRLQGTGVFSPHNAFRFVNAMTIPHASVVHFRQLANMFIAMAPVKSRSIAIRQSGLPGVLNNRAITEAGRQRALAYFGL